MRWRRCCYACVRFQGGYRNCIAHCALCGRTVPQALSCSPILVVGTNCASTGCPWAEDLDQMPEREVLENKSMWWRGDGCTSYCTSASCKRVSMGLAHRAISSHGSGDLFIAFSTGKQSCLIGPLTVCFKQSLDFASASGRNRSD